MDFEAGLTLFFYNGEKSFSEKKRYIYINVALNKRGDWENIFLSV